MFVFNIKNEQCTICLCPFFLQSDNVPFPNVSLIIITQYFLNEFQAYGRSLVPAPESLKMF